MCSAREKGVRRNSQSIISISIFLAIYFHHDILFCQFLETEVKCVCVCVCVRVGGGGDHDKLVLFFVDY